MEKIPIYGSEAKRFYEHINYTDNCRIIFSAPYGYGKTTFLKQISSIEYGAKEFPAHKYNFFHICPVNYSVASNEDIFQYIKYDLIYSLIENKFPIKAKDFSITKGMKKYLKSNAHILASKLLLFVPNVGKDLFEIFEELNKVKDEIIEACVEESKGEEDKFSEYLLDIESKTGSIYEFDIFTKTIQNVLNRIKLDELGNEVKQNILIIDDLDRIDPAHIFRILNVFSAHLDTDGKKNKFGFDKVVLVCDLINIRRIYAHIYGQSVDFNGYIDKFYSSTVFEFANLKVIEDYLVKELTKNQFNRYYLDVGDLRVIIQILTTFIVNGKLNMRRLKNISEINIAPQVEASYRKNHSPLKQITLFDMCLFLIEVLGNYENLKSTLEEITHLNIEHKAINDNIDDFNEVYLKYILPVLVIDKSGFSENTEAYYGYHGEQLSLQWKSAN
ncbi:MAG: P-loop NTPase fold protein, partial [Nitrososphaeraceae archaeon]